MQATVPVGDWEFVLLCVDESDVLSACLDGQTDNCDDDPAWWEDIFNNSTFINPPSGSSCEVTGTANYGFTVDGLGNDMTVSICAGTCEDDCPHTCADFSAGTFSLALDDNGEYNLSASGTDWSIDQCGNYAAADASTPVADVYFTADCTMTSADYNGSVSLSLSLASLGDDGSAAGTVTILGLSLIHI